MTETNFGLQEIREVVPVEMELNGVRIQLSFAESEAPGIRDRMIEILSRVQKCRLPSTDDTRTFWKSDLSKSVKKSITDVKNVTLASFGLPCGETFRGTIAYRKRRKLENHLTTTARQDATLRTRNKATLL